MDLERRVALYRSVRSESLKLIFGKAAGVSYRSRKYRLMVTKRAPVDHTRRELAPAQLSALAAVEVNDVHPTVMQVIGPRGRRLTLNDLPLPDTTRWVIRRKAEIVAAIGGGLLSLDEACSRYALNSEELRSWQNCFDRFGLAGLRTTRIQFYLRSGAKPKP
jgi:hypothetical protein